MGSISFYCKTAMRVDPLLLCPNQYTDREMAIRALVKKRQRREMSKGEGERGGNHGQGVRNMRVGDESTGQDQHLVTTWDPA